METTAQRIAGIAADAHAALLAPAVAIDQLALLAESRGGTSGRRDDGAYFTDQDVARYLARRAIIATLLDSASGCVGDVDELLASGADLPEALTSAARHPGARDSMRARLGTLVVLDPTCGAGSFLVAAWEALTVARELLGGDVGLRLDQLHGFDQDPDAVAACRATLTIACGDAAGSARIEVADAEQRGVLPAADIVLGNPPFARARPDTRHVDLATSSVRNRSAWIVERSLAQARPGARIGFVLPVSTACTDAFAPARACWEQACDRIHATHFDTIPSTLFRGVVQRLSFFEGRRRSGVDNVSPALWWTSRYHRWLRSERPTLLEGICHVPLPRHAVGGSLAKVGTELEAGLLDQLFRHAGAGRHFTAPADGAVAHRFHSKRRWSYFLLFTDFVPGIWNADGSERQPSELKSVDVHPRLDARVLLATYSSTLFWWYFSVFTDNRNVNRRDLAAFPVPDLEPETERRLAQLGAELMESLRACSEVRTCTYRSVGTIRNTYFRQGATRPVLDSIDRELATAYGMSARQLEFVLGFERRFRS